MGPETSTRRMFSVHELSQFVYCPRAGVIAVEAEKEDDGEEGRPINLGYLPKYILMNLETAIARYAIALFALLGIAVLAFIGAGVAALGNNVTLFRFSQWTMGLSLLASVAVLGGLGTVAIASARSTGKTRTRA